MSCCSKCATTGGTCKGALGIAAPNTPTSRAYLYLTLAGIAGVLFFFMRHKKG
jgi:hypothetical protein